MAYHGAEGHLAIPSTVVLAKTAIVEAALDGVPDLVSLTGRFSPGLDHAVAVNYEAWLATLAPDEP